MARRSGKGPAWGDDTHAEEAPKQTAKKQPKHVAAKIVLIGDGGVGKSSLGRWLAYGDASEDGTHAHERIWNLTKLGKSGSNGTKREAILWDFEGHPDQRLILPLWLGDADLALVLFDPTLKPDPLTPVVYWLELLERQKAACCRKILVGTRVDRGTPTISVAELEQFCQNWKIRRRLHRHEHA